MKVSVIAETPQDARKQAEARIGHRGVYVSSVFFVPRQPGVREYVFSTVLLS